MDDSRELLRLEADLLFGLDADGRLGRDIDAVVNVTPDGDHEVLTGRIGTDFAPGDVVAGPTPPPSLERLRKELTKADGIDRRVTGGPSFLVPVAMSRADDDKVVTSTEAAAAREARRPSSWQPAAWRELLDGGTGAPWAMVVHDGAVVSVCHTPRANPVAAEAGTWTDPDQRGCGFAAAATAAWSGLFPSATTLFYSTAMANRSSQAVAARLQLRFIGWMWKVTSTSWLTGGS